MKFHPSFFDRLREKLVGESGRSIYLNALPGRTGARIELHDLFYIVRGSENRFLQLLFTEESFSLELAFPVLHENADQQLKTIYRKFQNICFEQENLIQETGVAAFSFGYPLLVHAHLDNIWVSPLTIWSLDIHWDIPQNTMVISRNKKKKNGKWVQEDLHDFGINETLSQHFKRLGRTGLPALEPFLNEDDLLDVSELNKWLVQFGTEQNVTSNSFKNEYIQSYLGASILPLPNKDRVKVDFQEQGNYLIFSGVFGLFKQKKSALIQELDGLETIELFPSSKPLNRIPFSPIPTDPTQQQILMNLGESEVTVIQGPPGTGKSQTLSAIITQALINQEKILVVCEKKTAMDVLVENLRKADPRLLKHVALLEDAFSDRDALVTLAREKMEEKAEVVLPASVQNVVPQMQQITQDILDYESRLDRLKTPIYRGLDWPKTVELFTELGGPISLQQDLPHPPFQFHEDESDSLFSLMNHWQKWNQQLPHWSKHILFPLPLNELTLNSATQAIKQFTDWIILWKSEDAILKESGFYIIWEKYADQWNHWFETGKKVHHEWESQWFLQETGFSLRYKNLFSWFNPTWKKQKEIRNTWLNQFQKWCKQGLELGIKIHPNIESIKQIGTIDWNQWKNIQPFEGWEEMEQYSELQKVSFAKILTIQNNFNHHPWKNWFQWDAFDLVSLEKLCRELHNSIPQISLLYEIKKSWEECSTEEQTWLIEWDRQGSNQQQGERWYLHWYLLNQMDLKLPSDVLEAEQLTHRLTHLAQPMLDLIENQEKNRLQKAMQKFKEKGISPIGLYNKRGAKGQRRNSIRQIIQTDPQLFTDLFPVVMMNPITACNVLPKNQILFDWILFDESSQLRIEDTFLCLTKAHRAIISGDSQQMPPSDYFSNDLALNPDEEESEIYAEEEAQKSMSEAESLLEFATHLPQANSLQLRIHYRSEHPNLIQFSNSGFYKNQLVPLALQRAESPIIFHQMDGIYQDSTNRKEAEAIIQAIKKIKPFANGSWPTLGIGTLNLYQRNLILTLIAEHQNIDPEFANIWQFLEPTTFVKNLENIQGDERDIIFLSTTFGNDKLGKFKKNFGPLSRKNGSRLLNVLITRAKKRIEIFCSFPQDALNISSIMMKENGKTGSYYLLSYLRFAQANAKNQLDSVQQILSEISPENTPPSNKPNIFDHWSEEHKKALIKNGGLYLPTGTRFLWTTWGRKYAERKQFWVHQSFTLRWLTHHN